MGAKVLMNFVNKETSPYLLHPIEKWVLGICLNESKLSKSYDHNLVDKSAERIKDCAAKHRRCNCGPIPFNTYKERSTVLRSPHVNKKSRE